MTLEWKEDQPIYRQLRDKVAAQILTGSLKEGESLPSVRNVAVELQINPLTASRAYQELVDEALVEKRRGLGMFIVKGARSKLLTLEKKRFLEDEWPEINARISALGLSAKDLLKTIGNKNGSKK
ncbi:MAG: GntR family transcriptional regulator [Alphaproteobacteria bacterium]|nr:MAG: GntR family transcriptional regulator [Alphaproteobacteria bacterium]